MNGFELILCNRKT